jgi:hypothetical protein
LSFTIPANHVLNDTGHTTDHDSIIQVLAVLANNNILNSAYSGGADPLGVSDSAPAIQAAINALPASGGVIVMPAGTYKLGSPLSLTVPCVFMGAGREATILTLANGVNDYAIKFTQGTGVAITGAYFADLQINGNAINQTAGGGISANGAVECTFERIHFTNCYNWGLALQAIPGGAFGHNNRIVNCTFDNAAAAGFGGGLWMTSNDENLVLGCDFQFLGGTASPSGSSLPVALYDQSGLHMIQSCTFVGSRGSNTNVIGIRIQNMKKTRVVGCTFDGQGGDNVFLAGQECAVVGNMFTSIGDQAATAGTAAGVHLEFAAANNTVTGNCFDSSSTNGRTGYFIYEQQIGSSGPNVITDNTMTVVGTLGVQAVLTAGVASQVARNIGFNPIGKQTAPGIPASTTPLTNPFNVDCSVWISGGTVTVISMGGQATGQTSGYFLLPAGQTITLTYTVAPAWVWFGN